MTWPLLLLFVAAEGPPSPPGAELYLKARANMAEILANQPNYTCLETIDRSERLPRKVRFETIDSLRLEVAYMDKQELYAWPGSKKFDHTSLFDMVPEGAALTTGAFAGHAQYLFREGAATIQRGEWVTDEKGKRAARYPFSVSAKASHYELMRTRRDGEVVAYSGYIWIEPESARVFQIQFHADSIPARLQIEATETTIEYGPGKIGEREYWLPAQSIESITSARGITNRNVTQFSNCHAFTGESTLRFDDMPEASVTSNQPPKVIDLPANLWFDIRFDQPVDPKKVHLGDPVAATLATDIKQKGKLLFPYGSPVEMRVVRMQQTNSMVVLEVVLGDVTTAGSVAHLSVTPDRGFDDRARVQNDRVTKISVRGDPKRPSLGTIYIGGNWRQVPKGFRSTWVTTMPSEGTR